MTVSKEISLCEHIDELYAYALRALPVSAAGGIKAHLETCAKCRTEMRRLQPVLDSFAGWPTDILRPTTDLWAKLSERLGINAGETAANDPGRQIGSVPNWREVANGIQCRILAKDAQHNRVSMLVRLAPGVEYPPHTHAGIEELHLLDGELWINDRKLYPGDYSRAESGTSDTRVWSETGCTCVLITSADDALG